MFQLKKLFTVLTIVNILLLLAFVTGVALADCTTAICPPGTTKDGSIIWAKSGQRPHEESFFLANTPRATHAPGETVHLIPHVPREDRVYAEIPQAPITYAVRADMAYNKTGYEEGMNEWGVSMGNFAMRARYDAELYAERDAALDPNRPVFVDQYEIMICTLERAKTAREGIEIMIDLEMKYGPHKGSQQAYVICDPDEAWVIQFPAHGYIAWRLPDDQVLAFTNIACIRTDYDVISPNLISDAIKMGWHKEGDEFDFAFSYMGGDAEDTYTPRNEVKRARVQGLLDAKTGEIDVAYVMAIMRDHREGDWLEPRFMPSHFYRLVDETTPTSSTAGTMVAHLRKGLPDSIANVYWRALASPRTSVFTPLYWGGDIPEEYEYMATTEFDEKCPWWAFDVLDRMSRANYEVFNPIIRTVWESLEERYFRETHLIEKQVIELTKAGKDAEVKQMLTDFHRNNLEREWNIAKGLAYALQELHNVYPGRIISFYEPDNEASNINAGLMDLWTADLYGWKK